MSKTMIKLLSEDVQLKIAEIAMYDNELLATALIFAMAELEEAHKLRPEEITTPEQAHELLSVACESALSMINNLLDTIESQQEVKH